METKELKIEIPTGYVIDESKSTFEKIVFKKKDTKPRSWEDYCKQEHHDKHDGYYINNGSRIFSVNWGNVQVNRTDYLNYSRNILPSKELAAVFLAMMQLMALRQSWIGDWKADFSNSNQCKWCIVIDNNRIIDRESFYGRSHPLSFPTEEMAIDFIDTFKDLIEIAKPLI